MIDELVRDTTLYKTEYKISIRAQKIENIPKMGVFFYSIFL